VPLLSSLLERLQVEFGSVEYQAIAAGVALDRALRQLVA
jgi:hypothetical protein